MLYSNGVFIENHSSYRNTIDYKSNSFHVTNRDNYSNLNCHFIFDKNLSLGIFLEEKDRIFDFKNSDFQISHKGFIRRPKINISFLENNIFTIDNQLNYNFNLEIPVSNFLSTKLYGSSESEVIDNTNLSNDLTIDSDFNLTSYGIDLSFYLNSFVFTIGLNNREIESKPSTNDRALSLVLKSNDYYTTNLHIKYDLEDSSISLGYSYENFSFEKNRVLGLSGDSLFFYLDCENFYNSNKFNLSYTWRNYSLSLIHKIYHFNKTEGFLETQPFIFGPLAFRKYHFSSEDFNLYNTQLNFFKKIESLIGDTYINASLSRLYRLDPINHTHNYNEKIWSFLGYSIIGGIDDTVSQLEYDHINLLNIDIQHQIVIKDIKLKFGINQILPFFDSVFQNANKGKSNTESNNNSNDSTSVSGGTTLFLIISYFL